MSHWISWVPVFALIAGVQVAFSGSGTAPSPMADLNRALSICGAIAADGGQLPAACDPFIAASMAMQLGLPHVADLVGKGRPTAADLRWLRELKTP